MRDADEMAREVCADGYGDDRFGEVFDLVIADRAAVVKVTLEAAARKADEHTCSAPCPGVIATAIRAMNPEDVLL